MDFSGFHPEGLDLLIENRMHNDKNFYEEHKPQLQSLVLEPFYALIERLTPDMLRIDPLLVIKPRQAVSRVRRDTRFSKDKTLYRANIWITFSRMKDSFASRPCFYFEISPENWSYGCGYYQAPPAEMRRAREMILAEDKRFLDAFHAVNSCKIFSLYGDCYKRPHFPDAPECYQPWLNRKNLGVSTEFTDHAPLFDGSFVPDLINNFHKIAPFYHFLCTIKAQENTL